MSLLGKKFLPHKVVRRLNKTIFWKTICWWRGASWRTPEMKGLNEKGEFIKRIQECLQDTAEPEEWTSTRVAVSNILHIYLFLEGPAKSFFFKFLFICFFIQQVLVTCLFYAYWCVCVGPNLPIQPPPATSPLGVHAFVLYICVSISALQALHLCLYFCLASLYFICAIFLDSTYMHWHTMFVFLFLTCFTLWQSLGPSGSLQVAQLCSFLWLSGVPLYVCATPSLSIRLSMGI